MKMVRNICKIRNAKNLQYFINFSRQCLEKIRKDVQLMLEGKIETLNIYNLTNKF